MLLITLPIHNYTLFVSFVFFYFWCESFKTTILLKYVLWHIETVCVFQYLSCQTIIVPSILFSNFVKPPYSQSIRFSNYFVCIIELHNIVHLKSHIIDSNYKITANLSMLEINNLFSPQKLIDWLKNRFIHICLVFHDQYKNKADLDLLYSI